MHYPSDCRYPNAGLRLGFSVVGLLALCVSWSSCAPTQRDVAVATGDASGQRPTSASEATAEPVAAPNAGSAEGEVAAQDGEQEPQEIEYRVELEDQSFSRTEKVRHLEWSCGGGVCRASGKPLRIGVKSCVSLGATLGVQIKSFHYGDEALPPEAIARCRQYLSKQEESGKFAEIRKRQQEADATPTTLGPNQGYIEITAFDGQMELRGGGIRFVFMDGSVVLQEADGRLFRFDAERRLSDAGEFARWQSVRGHYTASEVKSDAITLRCSRTNGGTVLVPWEIRHQSSRTPACQPHKEDFLLVYDRVDNPAAAHVTSAKRTLFETPYARDAGWSPKSAAKGAPQHLEVVVGSAQSVPGYHKGPAKDMLTKVHGIVTKCANELAGKLLEVEGKGELMLLLNPFGQPRTALVRRTTFAQPERLSACIEQRSMKESYQTTFDVFIRVPFDINAAGGPSTSAWKQAE